jgi:hypothetical protein
MTFEGGSAFQAIKQDPNVQTFVAKNAVPGKALEFTVSGTGSMPREDQGTGGAGQDATAPSGQPGGGIGAPINTPDPLTKYKWWILGGLALLLVTAAAFLLRKPAGSPSAVATYEPTSVAAPAPLHTTPGAKNTALLSALKEELFSLESERLTGTVSAAEYSEVKGALEIVLKRALNRK